VFVSVCACHPFAHRGPPSIDPTSPPPWPTGHWSSGHWWLSSPSRQVSTALGPPALGPTPAQVRGDAFPGSMRTSSPPPQQQQQPIWLVSPPLSHSVERRSCTTAPSASI